jgi:dolichyl-phosphate-mannose--protein O-mannosyl transferase
MTFAFFIATEPFEQAAPASVPASGAMQFGAMVKLQHVKTGARLHSHPHKYPEGSKQQQATCYHGSDDNDCTRWRPEGCVSPRHSQQARF